MPCSQQIHLNDFSLQDTHSMSVIRIHQKSFFAKHKEREREREREKERHSNELAGGWTEVAYRQFAQQVVVEAMATHPSSPAPFFSSFLQTLPLKRTFTKTKYVFSLTKHPIMVCQYLSFFPSPFIVTLFEQPLKSPHLARHFSWQQLLPRDNAFLTEAVGVMISTSSMLLFLSSSPLFEKHIWDSDNLSFLKTIGGERERERERK